MRSWILLVALSAMLILVAACDDDGDSDDVPAEEDATAEVQPTETPEPEPTEAPEPTATPEPEPTETPEPTPEPEPTEVADDEDTDADPRSGRATNGESGDLEGYLLSLDDLPTGWTQEDDDFGDDEFEDVSDEPFDAPCGIELPDEPFDTVAEGERSFEGSELGPFLFQNLMQLESEAQAEAAFGILRDMFSCDEWTEVDDFGDEMTFTIDEIPFDGAGDEAFAIELGFSFGDEMPELDMFVDIGFEIVILRRGEFVTMLMYFDIFGMSDADFQSIVQIADGKLQN